MTDQKKNAPTPVGVALEKARHRVGFSSEAASMAAGISTRELAQIESGLRLPKPEILKDLSRAYGVDPMRFGTGRWVPRVPPRYDAEAGVIWLGYISIAYSHTTHDNDYLLRSIGGAIRTMRSLDSQKPIFLRSNDYEVLAELIDLDHPQIVPDMMRNLNQDEEHVEWLIGALKEVVAKPAVLQAPF